MKRTLQGMCLAARVALLLLALGVGTALAADERGSAEQRLGELKARLDKSEANLQVIVDNARNRAGFIDEEEALRRYEDAVFFALTGDHETAALEFTILLEAGALQETGLRADGEWYLAEAHFAMENFETAIAAYDVIVAQGQPHQFFPDAIRRLLEIYGLTGQNRKFQDLFDGYIATRRVESTPLINYTLAKSFYRQKNWARAKAMFAEFPADSPYYAKARYFIGTILVQQGNLPDAEKEFQLATKAGPNEEKRQEVLDLAWLALGRVEYELGNYREATEAYLKVSRESPWFADQLYEIVWTFVRQQEYEEAIRALDIFLIAFPEHKYTGRLKVLRGHLHMKRQRYESALTTYEEVVREYGPVLDLVIGSERSEEQPRVFFERLSKADALQVLSRSGLPPYAAEMLKERAEVSRTVRNRRILEEQEKTLKESREVVDDLAGRLVGGLSTLGSFRNAREKLRWLVREKNDLMGTLLAIEEDYLRQNSGSGLTRKLDLIRAERLRIASETERERREGVASADIEGVMLDQVRAVQARALQVEQVARETVSVAESLEQSLNLGRYRVPPEQEREIRQRLSAVRAELNGMISALQPFQADAFPLTLLGAAPGPARGNRTESKAAVDRHVAVHESYLALARDPAAPPSAAAFFERTEALWSRLQRYEVRIPEALALFEEIEKREVTLVQQDIASQSAIISDLARQFDSVLVETDTLGSAAVRTGFEDLGVFFDSSVMRADMGIVDVYWLRKQQVSDRIDELSREKVRLLKDLDRRFKTIHENLEE